MSTRRTKRPLLIGTGALAATAALILGGAVAASAHVGIAEGPVEAGSYSILTFGVPHGCDGSATTEVAIQIPEGINAVTPTRNGLYTVEKVMEDLATPITDSHGNEVTERVAQVVYTTSTPLPDGQRDAFELSLQIPEDAADTTLYFPTVQTCEQGETAWVQIPEEGQDGHELDAPAPSVDVVAASDAGSHGHGDSSEATVDAHDEDSASATAPADQTPLVVTSLAVGALGLIVAVIALLRGRKKA
ncbi:Conserved membrane protein in copper uptake, YcnI [Leucobacter sp. 7(1)]|uniref:YcnI family copper-binding membrane protein n=1 Tax=Leucobacter sp. 7(1) TaxID=1255613 RepID=UPI00097F6459|nr:YcnI family protein [Leucobacter sp. 7(1)]SJN12043.1 Conserved membrane protein in copper uptake, YcnI [Leucobacter sp. 7(1)]